MARPRARRGDAPPPHPPLELVPDRLPDPRDAPPEQSADADADDEFEDVPESEGLAEESAEERVAAKKAYFPSSMGLSTLVAAEARALTVTVRWGDYALSEHEPGRATPIPVWRRTPREATVELPLGERPGELAVHDVPDSGGLELHALERPVAAGGGAAGIPPGTRSVSVFLVNKRPPDTDQPDLAYAFQPELELRCDGAVRPPPRPARRRRRGLGRPRRGPPLRRHARVRDRARRLRRLGRPRRRCAVLRTRWIPRAEVEKTETAPIEGVELSMRALGDLADGDAARAALTPLVERYREWIADQRDALGGLTAHRRETAELLLANAEIAANRIERGIEALAADPDALDAFRVANRAVAAALRRRLEIDEPRWRAFQLAFILVNLPGIADPGDLDRETVDLLFFPTGGGKTEAYLGLSAFTMVLRRLRHPEAAGAPAPA